MLKIRLQKVGKKNSPSYRIVLSKHTSKPQGKYIELLGFYNPRLKEKKFRKERIEYWLSKGAQPSPTVHNLLVEEGILKGIKLRAWRPKKKKEKDKEKSAEKSAEAPMAEKKEELDKKEEKPKEEKPGGVPPAAEDKVGEEPKSEEKLEEKSKEEGA